MAGKAQTCASLRAGHRFYRRPEIAEDAVGLRRKAVFPGPHHAYVHAGYRVAEVPPEDAIALQRPRAIHEVGQNGDPLAQCDKAAHRLDRSRLELNAGREPE